ncbi:MAG: hypothetical protein H6624_15425 [Bdellovibrionaceae bacterium]|nr:hypothetical protein [Bdellovibrionales bacterium]MCB9085737.1 hypothetical protein [Pseudobdellovibrionaceae bacterium]
MKILICVLLALTFVSEVSLAQENDGAKIVTADDDGGGITNSKMKAMAGSESRYSFKMNLKYLGSSIKDPGKSNRPNPDNSLVIPKTELQGSVSGVYRIDKSTTLAAGTGITFVEPEKNLEQSEMATPYLTYSHSFSKYGMEHNSSAKYSYYTGRTRDSGRDMHLTLSHYFAKKVGDSRLTIGADVGIGGSTFTVSDTDDLDWGWGLSPFAEYMIKDGFTATVVVVTGGSHYRLRDKIESDTILAELGVGIAATEKIYVNPVIAMYPEDPNLDTTTFSVNTIVNAF